VTLSFLKLDINILDDQKIKIIRKYPAGDSLFIFWIGLLCMAMKSETAGYVYVTKGVPYEPQQLADEFGIDLKIIEMGLTLFKRYRMIDITSGGAIEVVNFNRHQSLDKIERARIASRKSSQQFRKKQKRLLIGDSHVTVTTERVTKQNKTKNKIKKKSTGDNDQRVSIDITSVSDSGNSRSTQSQIQQYQKIIGILDNFTNVPKPKYYVDKIPPELLYVILKNLSCYQWEEITRAATNWITALNDPDYKNNYPTPESFLAEGIAEFLNKTENSNDNK